jgi:hypothetical protein
MGKQNRQKEINKRLEREKYKELLTSTKPKARAAKRAKKDKRKTYESMSGYVNIDDLKDNVVRKPEEWESKSYNIKRQIQDYIRHLFVIYPVPTFLYEAFGYDPKIRLRQYNGTWIKLEPCNFIPWFMAIAQGKSFHKLVKGIMTKREANAFLKSPQFNTIEESVWWARLTVAGIQSGLTKKLIIRFFIDKPADDFSERYKDLIVFFNKFQNDIDKHTFDEISDFIADKFTNDQDFSLKGRTLGSVIRLSNEWHLMIHKAKVNTYKEWEPIDVPDWIFKDKEKTVWCVEQITNNIDLVKEGRRQRHCVYSYTIRCEMGKCFIFTMESSREGKLLTLELDANKRIVQARGKFNRSPTAYERRVILRWALDKHLTVAY